VNYFLFHRGIDIQHGVYIVEPMNIEV